MAQKVNVVKNFLYNASYHMLCVITPLITAPYVSRVLGAGGIGSFNYTQSVASYFILFGTLGGELYGQREIAYVQDDRDKRTTTFKNIEILRLITVFFSLAVYFFVFCFKEEINWLYWAFLLEIIAAAFDVSWFFRGMQDFKRTVKRNFFVRIVSVVLIFLLVKSKDDVVLYALCYAIPILAGNISLWFYLPKYLSKAKADKIFEKGRIIALLAMFVPQIATEVYLVLDKTMLGALSQNMSEVGFYSQAQRLVQVALKFITAFGVVMLPHVSQAFANNNFEKVRSSIVKSMRFVFFLGFPMMFGLMAIAQDFIPWFLGDGFDKVALLIMLMSPIIVIIGMSNVIGTQYLLSTKQQSKYTISVFVGMFTNLLCNVLLIPKFGAIGATIATIAAECSVTLVQFIEVRKEINFIECVKYGIRYAVCSGLMFTMISFVGSRLCANWIATIIEIIIGVLTYVILLAIVKDEFLQDTKTLVRKKVKVRK